MPQPRLTFNDHIDKALARAEVVLNAANGVRRRHRRNSRPGDPQRQKDIHYEIQRIDGLMKTVRSLVGKLPWEDHTPSRADKLTEASRALQYERRQLKKMAR